MSLQQQRAIIIIVFLGCIVLTMNQFKSPAQETKQLLSTAELNQHIDTHPLLFFQTLNINTASKEELLGIPRIGPVLAGRITDYRNQHGAFQKLDDLKHVQGIGAKTVIHLRQYCHIGERR